MLVWSHRPPLFHFGLFLAACLLAAWSAHVLAIVPHTGISVWPASGLLLATLIRSPSRSLPWWIAGGLIAALCGNALWFHSPLPVALLIYLGSVAEASAGAWLVKRILARELRLETLREVMVLTVAGAALASMIGATVGSATLHWYGMQSFTTSWPLWWLGDATGVLLVAPLVLAISKDWRSQPPLFDTNWIEVSVLGGVLVAVTALAVGSYLPFAYIVMPPLLWASVRFERRGAIVTLCFLAVATVTFTLFGTGQFAGDLESQRHRQIMLQLFLAISASSALIVAAISHQYRTAVSTLQESVRALQSRERELSQLIDLVPAHIRRLTPDGQPTFFNKRLLDFFGMDEIEYLDRLGSNRLASAMKTFVHPEDSSLLIATLEHSLVTGSPYLLRYRMLRADGVYRWVEGRGEPVREPNGKIIHWLVISIDIEDEVRAQEALRKRELEYSQLVDMVPSLLWRLTPEGEPVFFSKRMVEYLGLDVGDYDETSLTGLAAAIAAVVHPDDAELLADTLDHSFSSGEPFSLNYRLRRADGAYRWMLGRAEPLRDETGRILQWYGLCNDIDDRLRAEQALRTSNRQLAQMIDALPINILSFAPSGEMTYTSKRYLDTVGSPPGNIDDFNALAKDLAHPDDFPTMFARASHGFATGEPFINRFRRRDRDGIYRWIEARAQPLRDDAGKIVQWYIISIDIEDEMQAQKALQERERFLWQLVETLPAMIDCAAPNGEPVYRSQQLREFLGYELEELDEGGKSRLNGTLDAGVHPDDVAGLKEQYVHCLATGEPYARRHRLRRFDGEYRWVETRAAPMRDAAGDIVQWNVICLDIDEEVRTQEKLLLAQESLARASQAASLAELSASIAHEVNQPLSAVMNYSSACQRWLLAAPPNIERARRTVELIITSANSAADVVNRIRALFQRSAGVKTSTTLDTVIADTRNLLAEEAARRRVVLEVDSGRDLQLAPFDRVQIQQVLFNLMRNGIDAMTSVAHQRILQVRVHELNDMARIEVSDRGRGVQFPDKIFEPFFTTKEQGMGMGLAISKSIVEAHGGRIWAEKNEPHGARFVFTLPVENAALRDQPSSSGVGHGDDDARIQVAESRPAFDGR